MYKEDPPRQREDGKGGEGMAGGLGHSDSEMPLAMTNVKTAVEWQPHRRKICMTRKLTRAALAGITAQETSCPLEHAYRPGWSARLMQENGYSGPSHVGKPERKR